MRFYKNFHIQQKFYSMCSKEKIILNRVHTQGLGKTKVSHDAQGSLAVPHNQSHCYSVCWSDTTFVYLAWKLKQNVKLCCFWGMRLKGRMCSSLLCKIRYLQMKFIINKNISKKLTVDITATVQPTTSTALSTQNNKHYNFFVFLFFCGTANINDMHIFLKSCSIALKNYSY